VSNRVVVILGVVGASVLAAIAWRGVTTPVNAGHVSRTAMDSQMAGNRLTSAPTGSAPNSPLPDGVVKTLHLDPNSIVVEGTFSGVGNPTIVVTASDSARTRQCVVIQDPNGTAAGCSPSLLSTSSIADVESWSGGPSVRDRTDFVIGGVTAPGLQQIAVGLSNGASLPASVSGRAFLVHVPTALVVAGVTPTSIEANRPDGSAIAPVVIAEH
jgi:hypothetical protein